jgi:ATP/maltotriose-dependent transcriptional regulator MalT
VRAVLMRILAVLGVAVWCVFVLFVSLAFVIDRGLADVGIVWMAVLGIGVGAPALLLWQANRVIRSHEESRRAAPSAREGEKELLDALEEYGELTPATAAMRTSLTVDEAAKMLERLARKSHLESHTHDSVTAYALAGRNGQRLAAGAEPRHLGAPGGLDEPLSERELEVLRVLASGRTNSEAARDLYVSVGTVKSHTGNIYRKLGAKNRAEAVARARDLNLLP